MWSIEYIYEASNKNCMVMQFTGENPNLYGDPYKDPPPSKASDTYKEAPSKTSSGSHHILLYVFILFLIFIWNCCK